MKKYLGLDFGEKRIGVAISDGLGLTAQPKPFIYNNEATITSIKKIIEEENICAIILGLPKDREGKEGKKATEVRQFMKILESLNLPIILQDERYSTVAVTKHLLTMDVKRKKRKQQVDSQAAAFILQGYLDKLN